MYPPTRIMRLLRVTLRAVTLSLLVAFPSFAQGLDLTVNHVGLAIGEVPRVTGLRLNYRDRKLERVDGVNATIWTPYGDGGTGVVNGLALGVPVTGAARINGIGAGILGVGARDRLRGIGVGAAGVGSGGALEGIMVGGLGVGSGGDITGIGVGGLGLGSGGSLHGAFVGGLGVGSGQDIVGIVVGGLGAGASRDIKGIVVGGAGVGAAGEVKGIAIGGLGVGAGGDLTGLAIGGIGVGSGGKLRGVAIGGLGAGAEDVRGLALAGFGAGARDVRGALVSLGWNRLEHGTLRGVSISSFNQMKGAQRGLAIGIVNYAEELHGVQIGLLNIARNNSPGTRVLPLINAHRGE